eukprot:11725573-Heterocapsa_arctica.AAC.1
MELHTREDLVAAVSAPAEAREPTAPEGWGAKLLDLKGVARPPLFDGKPQSYSDWRFRFLAVADLLDLADPMRAAEKHPSTTTFDLMNAENKRKSKFLYGIFVQ